MMKSYTRNLNRKQSDGFISYALSELIAAGISIERYSVVLKRVRVIPQRDGTHLEYVDIPIGLARHLGLMDI